MAARAPRTLEELAERAGISVEELAEFEEDVFMRLMEEQAVNAVATHRLRKKFRDLKGAQRHATAQEKFEGFYERVGGAESLEGLQHVPVATLPSALAFLRGVAGAPSEPALRGATRVAYAKADALLTGPEVLARDELAAVNVYTQDGWGGPAPSSLFRPLNAALRSEARPTVKAYWGYIRLLQHALFKLPADQSGVLYRGIRLDWPGAPSLADYRAEMVRKQESGEEEIWWGFSSTSTSLPAVRHFLGADGPRVIFTVEPGSSARDVRRYSHFQEGQAVPEDERLLPCGTAFVVKTADIVGEGLLMVGLRQTNDILIQGGAPAQAPVLHEAVVPAQPEPEPEPVPAEAAADALCAMGFAEPDVGEALGACGGDSARAVDWLVARADELQELEHASAHRSVQILGGAATGCLRVQVSGVERLRSLARDASLRGPIAAAGGVEAVLRGMAQHPDSEGVQDYGCAALGNLARDASLTRPIAAAGGVEAVLRGMAQHPDSEGVQHSGCGALGNLTADASLQRPIAAAGGVEAVLRGMAQHPDSERVQHSGCGALQNLAVDASLRGPIAAAGGVEAVLRGMAQHPDSEGVQHYGCAALGNLAADASLTRPIAAAGGVEAVLRGMAQHPDSEGVQQYGCAALWKLADDASLRGPIAAAGGVEAVLRGMAQHPDSEGVQDYGCAALWSLADDASLRGPIAAAGGVEAVLRGMAQHPDSERVQYYGCAALWSLADDASLRGPIAAAGGVEAVSRALASGCLDEQRRSAARLLLQRLR
eukprot:COSAG02_NODE_532_length_20668_cov_28.281832_16_plen_770_part_00